MRYRRQRVAGPIASGTGTPSVRPFIQGGTFVGEARRRLHSVARFVAVLTAFFAVANLLRWGNRWYVSTQMAAPIDDLWAARLLDHAHTALVSALLWTVLAIVAAGVGWQFRVVRHRQAADHVDEHAAGSPVRRSGRMGHVRPRHFP